MSTCDRCSGKPNFEEGPGKTWNVYCQAGRQGGCDGPSADDLSALDHKAAVACGSRPGTPPLQTDAWGRPITNRWPD